MNLAINHKTTYQYKKTVEFGHHRLMLRPRESPSLRLLSHTLDITPAATVTWALDVSGNAVATATFDEPADTLVIESAAELRLEADQWPVFDIAASAINYPFILTDDDMDDLGGLRLQSYLDSAGELQAWAKGFVANTPTGTLALLQDINNGVAAAISYEVREEENTQSPTETLARKSGSCRDYAVLFIDAVRSLGFGARLVSGYLYDAEQSLLGSSGFGSTHAWAEVFIPGAGWITFDPTNRSVGAYNLIPVAVGRHIRQTMPIVGSYIGDKNAFVRMDVQVSVAPGDHTPQT